MCVKSFISVAAIAAVIGLTASLASAVTIPTVPVGNPGNAPDTAVMGDGTSGYGSVTHTYNIGTTEVTNAQYAAFLNAVADTDTNNLYNIGMSGNGGIERTGSPGSYVYQTISGRENRPVNFVSYWDATRFANWLHNGQPSGPQNNSTTEDGAYTLTPGGISASTVTRNAGWQWAIPGENEWYKAAYHQPASSGGDSDGYWLYPTSTNNISLALANYANAAGGNTIKPVGTYAANFYGAFDMGGNVWEWNEAILLNAVRGVRGGSYIESSNFLRSDVRNYFNEGSTRESFDVGFRVVQVPGPSAAALLAIGGVVMSVRRRRA